MSIKWSPITLKQQSKFEELLQSHPVAGHEYSFANFYSWRENKNYLYAEYKNHLLIADTSVSKNWKIYEPIGPKPNKIIQEELPIDDEYSWGRISSKTAHKLTVDDQVLLDRDNHDYLYNVRDIVYLEGKKYDGKRNFIKKFHEKYNATVKPITKENIRDCYELSVKWAEQKNLSNSGDLFPLKEIIQNWDRFSFQGIGIYIENTMAGFALGEALSDDVFGERYEKGFTEFKGIYAALLHELAIYLHPQFTRINREQDLGIPGLRKSKLSWSPSGFVGKYMLSGIRSTKPICEERGFQIFDAKVLNDDSVQELYKACEWSVVERAPEKLAYALEHSDTVLSAWERNKLVGIATAISDGALVAYFPHLLVHPDFQKQGIGEMLVQCMIKKYESFDQKILISHKEALGFYKKQGFQISDPHKGMWIHNSEDL